MTNRCQISRQPQADTTPRSMLAASFSVVLVASTYRLNGKLGHSKLSEVVNTDLAVRNANIPGQSKQVPFLASRKLTAFPS